jgi:hypothetical protein
MVSQHTLQCFQGFNFGGVGWIWMLFVRRGQSLGKVRTTVDMLRDVATLCYVPLRSSRQISFKEPVDIRSYGKRDECAN